MQSINCLFWSLASDNKVCYLRVLYKSLEIIIIIPLSARETNINVITFLH
ncbi:hypothetical protein Plhal304r1_c031g0102031 [Plasmopara halstedii]